MGNDNETRYKLQLDARDFIDQLNRIQETLTKIDGIITQQGGKKFAIDVQIKNADFQRVFENLEKIMSRSEGSAERLGESIERAFGKSKSLDRATKAINDYEDAVRTSSQRVRDVANKTSEAISDVYKKQSTEVMTFISRADSNAKKFAQSASTTYSTAIRQIKKDLEELGINTTNMSAKDLVKFQQDLNKLYDRRQTSKDLTQTFRQGWEKTLNTVGEKMLASEERLADVRERNINAQTDKYRKEMEKIEDDLQRKRDADIEKEEKRRVRMALYGKNVNEASRMLQQQIAESSSPEGSKLTSQYNRAVQRIRGIYQAAVIHGRVENPETILAGLTELQQRSLALNNFRLSEQMGINELNEKLAVSVKRIETLGTTWNKVSSVVQNSVQAFSSVQSFASRITSTLMNFSRNVLTRISSQVRTLVTQSTEAFQSLEVSLIGFRNFFGDDQSERLYKRIKNIAAEAPGLGTTDLADYVKQIAPVSGGNADLALNAALGMLKTIQYGGASGSSEMEYVIKNVRDVLAKGKATAIDVRQFNRAMPILEEVLESVGQSQLLKDGILTIDKNNVDTILSAFAALNTSNQSAVAGIFSEMNLTLAGQWEQFTEQFTTNLMEMLRGSGVYGGVQNALMQINNGAYVEDFLARLQNSIANFIDNINWFKVQRVATEIWDGLKIVWEGVRDAAKNITAAIGATKSGNVIASFASWIADIIRGMSDGIAQVIKFVQDLEKSGVMDILSRIIGWLGSSGAILTKTLGTMASHATNIFGNVTQLVARLQKAHIIDKLSTLTEQLNGIPTEARSQIASSTDLLTGSDVANTEVGAINNLTNIVNAHLATIEANQVGSNTTLGKVETAVNNGKRYLYSDNYDKQGNAGIAVWDNKTSKWKQLSGYASNQKETAYADYQRLITQNRLQASSNSFLQNVGNNKYVDATLKWIKSAGTKILSFTQKLIGNLMQGGMTVMVTQAVSGIIESLDMFGDATMYIAGVVKTAGYTIAGVMIGRSFGGTAGGVVGALVGLGVGIASLVQTIKEKEAELANTKITEALDDAERAMYDQTVALLRQYGFHVDEESVVGAGALQQLAYYIKSTPVANRSTEEAVRYYNEAYKMLSTGYALKNYSESDEYGALGGTEIDLTNTSGAYFKQLAEMVRKYGLAEGQGYYYGEGVSGRSYYRDEDLTEQIPAEELLKNAFPNGVTDVQAKSLLGKANQLDTEYGEQTIGKLEELLADNTEFKTALENIDKNVADILLNIVNYLDKATPENLGTIYGAKAKEQASTYSEKAQGWENFKAAISSGWNSDSPYFGYGTHEVSAADYTNVRTKLGNELNLAEENGDADRAAYLQDWIDYIDNYEFGTYSGWMTDWVHYIIDKLIDYRKKFNTSFQFAKGGLVPAFAPVGVDTVPAMLSPGEFVMKPSVVRKAGLGVMHALNRGDLGAAARTLSQQVSNQTWNRNNTSTVNNKITNNNNNNFRIFNRNNSARMNSYFSLANRLTF